MAEKQYTQMSVTLKLSSHLSSPVSLGDFYKLFVASLSSSTLWGSLMEVTWGWSWSGLGAQCPVQGTKAFLDPLVQDSENCLWAEIKGLKQVFFSNPPSTPHSYFHCFLFELKSITLKLFIKSAMNSWIIPVHLHPEETISCFSINFSIRKIWGAWKMWLSLTQTNFQICFQRQTIINIFFSYLSIIVHLFSLLYKPV